MNRGAQRATPLRRRADGRARVATSGNSSEGAIAPVIGLRAPFWVRSIALNPPPRPRRAPPARGNSPLAGALSAAAAARPPRRPRDGREGHDGMVSLSWTSRESRCSACQRTDASDANHGDTSTAGLSGGVAGRSCTSAGRPARGPPRNEMLACDLRFFNPAGRKSGSHDRQCTTQERDSCRSTAERAKAQRFLLKKSIFLCVLCALCGDSFFSESPGRRP